MLLKFLANGLFRRVPCMALALSRGFLNLACNISPGPSDLMDIVPGWLFEVALPGGLSTTHANVPGHITETC